MFSFTNELLTISGQGARANGAAVRSAINNGFLAEAKQHYASRFDSITVQMALLDSFMEVAEHFNRPDLLEAVNYSAHLANACFEARTMCGDLRRSELRFALLNRHLPLVALQLFSAAARRISKRVLWLSQIRRANIAYCDGDVVHMSPKVTNIHDAAQELSRLLESF